MADPFDFDVDMIRRFNAAGGDALTMFNTSRERGNSLTADNQVLLDRASLTPFEFTQKYGAETTALMDELDTSAAQTRDMGIDFRPQGEKNIDMARGVATGINNSLQSIMTLGAAAVSPQLGTEIASRNAAYNEWANSQDSAELQEASTLNNIRTELDRQDNIKLFNEERKEAGDIIAGLKMFGRDAVSGAVRLIEEPAVAEQLVAEGVGSMVAGAPIARGLGIIGAALTKSAVPTTVAAMPAAIAAMEGGSAFSGASNEVMNTSLEDLAKNSPEFNQLIAEGLSPEAARVTLAGRAGNIAAGIQGPIGALTGGLVAQFEAAPFATRGAAETLKNIASETIEEGIQSATGEIAGNVAVNLTADENQNILENVGASTVQGALAGTGTAAVVQAPGAALATTANGLNTAFTLARDALAGRGEKIEAGIAAESPVSEEKVAEAFVAANENAPQVAEAINTLATENNANNAETDNYISRVVASTKITPEEVSQLPEHISNTLTPSEDRFNTLAQVARIAANEDAPQEDRISAGNFLLDQLKNNKKLFTQDIPEFLDEVPHDRPEYQQFERYAKIVSAVYETPAIRDAIRMANAARQSDIEGPATQQIANNTASIATLNPQNINPQVAEQVLSQTDRGDIQLTPEQINNIRAATSLIRSGQVYDQELGVEPSAEAPSDIVARQIEKDGGYKAHQLSMEQHVRRINEAASTGDQDALRQRMKDLALFSRHMRNKVNALIQSANNGGKSTKFQSLGPEHKWMPEEKWNAVALHVNNINSVNFAKRVRAEALALANLANEMATIYPQFNIPPVTVAELPDLSSLVQERENTPERDLGDTQDASSETATNPLVSAEEASPPAESTSVEPVETAPEPEAEVVATTEPETPETSPEVSVEVSEPVVEQTTEVEVEAEIEPEVETPTVFNLKNTYENLFGENNYFKKAFSFPKKMTSRMVNLENPLTDLLDMLSDLPKLVEFMGKDIEYAVNQTNINAIEDLLNIGTNMRNELTARLWKHGNADNKLTEFLNGNEDIARWRRFRIFNLVENNGDQSDYNSNLIETAIIAALDWAVNSAGMSGIDLDINEVSQILGRNASTAETEQFNRGVSVDRAKRELASHIQKFWGVTTNNNIPYAYTKGIPEAVASEMLKVLANEGFIELAVQEYMVDGKPKNFGRVYTDNRPENVSNLISDIAGADSLISDIALIEGDRPQYIGTPPTQVAEKQLRNPLVDNTRQQKKAIENAQNQPYHINETVFDFISNIGEKAFMVMMGGIEYSTGDLNVNHERSVEGINRTLTNSYRHMLKHVANVRSHAEKAGKKLSDIDTYFGFNITRVGRLQMLGLFNPQSDKLAREIFMPTKVTLDLTNPVGDDAKRFWMTVGQGIGLKTSKDTRNVIMEKAIASTMGSEGKLTPVVDQLVEWLDKREVGDLSLPPDITGDISRAMGGSVTMHAVHSLLSVAQYRKAHRDGKLKDFEHYNYLEADGKTNGPINSLALLTTGKFTPQWLKLIAKGGYFLGSSFKTLNQNPDKDLYETVADLLVEYQSDFAEEIQDNEKIKNQYDAFYRFMSALNVDISYDESGLKISRNATKNPLTISIYGSGKKGIAAKVAAELIDIIYEKMSEITNTNGNIKFADLLISKNGTPYGQAQFNADFKALTGLGARKDRETGEITLRAPKGDTRGPTSDSQTFTFSEAQINALRDNVLTFFVDQMDEAIRNGVMGNVDSAVNAVQGATNIQSIVFKAMFDNEVAARLKEKEKDPDWKKGDFLSDNEIQQIYKDLLHYGPIINVGGQSFFLSGSETSDTQPNGFSRSLEDDLSTAGYVYAPTIAGVKGTPSLVIGTGDGQMILNMIADMNVRGLPVFDGFNMPATDIDVSGRKANQAVYQTWQQNTVKAVQESFAEFLRNKPLETLKGNEFFIREMSKVISGSSKPAELASWEEINQYFSNMATELTSLTEDIDRRQGITSRVQQSIDQMASAESPYTKKGEITFEEGASFKEIADRLNEEYENDYYTYEPREAVDPGSKRFWYSVNAVAERDTELGVHVLKSENLPEVVSLLGSIPKIHQEMITNTLKVLDGYTIVFGNNISISNWKQANHPDRYNGINDAYGEIDPVTKTIYITNMSSETLVHELIHAATLDKTKAYYENKESLTKSDQEAIVRLEGLMNEWLLQDYSNEQESVQEASRMARSTIQSYLREERLGEALNEFMAWSLANQNIAEVQAKSKVKNPLFKIVGDALITLRKIIWGNKFSPNPGDTLFSNLRFNTRVLLGTPSKTSIMKSDLQTVALYQSPGFGTNDRIALLREKFFNKIVQYIKEGNRGTQLDRNTDAEEGLIAGQEVAMSFNAHGFSMTMQAQSTFAVIQAALGVNARLNPNSLSRMEDIYAHVIKNIKVEDFMSDPMSNDPNVRALAQEKYNVLNGDYITKTDTYGRSNLMSSFVALAMVDEGFRSILSKMDKPKTEKIMEENFDDYLTNLGIAGMDSLGTFMASEGNSPTMLAAMDALTNALLENAGDQISFIEQQTTSTLDAFDNFVNRHINDLSEKVVGKADDVLQNISNNGVVRGGARLVKFAASIINETRSAQIIEGITRGLNSASLVPNTIRELFSEVVGRTESNAPVFDMISKVRAYVQQTRQQFREKLPEQIASKFTRALTDEEWTNLYKALGKTDLAAIFSKYNTKAIDLINDAKLLNTEISALETSLSALAGPRWKDIQAKSKQLALFMNYGTYGDNLLRNPDAIAYMAGAGIALPAEADPMIESIDQLVTLYAIQSMDQSVKQTISDLSITELEGIKFAYYHLVGDRKSELEKTPKNANIKFNYYKGYIPSENKLGASLIVAADSEHVRLRSLGYQRVDSYYGSSADLTLNNKSYYFTPVSGRAVYNQGVLQTVHQTYSGIDPQTGYSLELNAGHITDPADVKDITRRLRNSRTTTENLMPVFDDNGKIIAYERTIDPVRLAALERNTHLAQMIGAWSGRQIEEKLAAYFNEELINNLHSVWLKDKADGRANEYISLDTSDDPIHKDSWNLIPNDLKDYIENRFGKDGFRIRKDMLNDAVGFRSASVGDLWTGNTRLKPAVQEKLQKTVAGIFKGDAYTKLVTGEKFIQNLVTEAKVLIVVKSVVVPAANLLSNVNQLLIRGVPITQVFRGLGSKTAEINDFIKRRDRQLKLDADLRAAKGANNTVLIRKLENELTSIKDSYKRMSIYPLIQAGEFSAITDGGITQEDLALANGRWASFVEGLANKLPEGLKLPARYALITKDTALFQGLTRAVQYGDFIGKAIMFDDLVNRKKLSQDEALARIGEEFVNYNRLAGRNRNYLESMGLIWFWNFKLRSIKTAVSMLRHNPVRALFMSTLAPRLPVIGSIGSPLTDNFFSVLADGKLGYSLGIGMGLNSPQLNPWMNMIR